MIVKINELTLKLVEKILSDEKFYGAKVNTLSTGQTVIDMTEANREGGKIVSEICMGGLGSVDFTTYDLDGHIIDAVEVKTSEPTISCMASQLAGWSIKIKKEVEKNGKLKKKSSISITSFWTCSSESKNRKIIRRIRLY